jgi:chemotaxis signal transduction protein
MGGRVVVSTERWCVGLIVDSIASEAFWVDSESIQAFL